MHKKFLFSLIFLLNLGLLNGQDPGARYLIITHDNFYDAIQPLAQWKHKSGLRTKVVKLSETGSSASEIRNYIVNAYNNWQTPPEYLLFVGAPNYLPFGQINGIATDNYYTNVSGDIYNEIISGRLTVHSVTEAQTVVNKILAYEQTPEYSDTNWFKKACFIVRVAYDPDDSIYWDDTYYAANFLVNNGFIEIDTLSNQFGHNSNSVFTAVNSGRSLVMYRGAAVNNWYSPFDLDPDNAQNSTLLPIVLSITCRTIGTGSTPATAEKWLLTGTPTTARGAAGYFATTTIVIDQAYLRSAVAKGFFDAIWVDNKKTFGQACEAGRIRVYQMYPYQGGGDEYYGFTTLGDPAMPLWTATPKQLNVSHESSLNQGNDTLHILATYQGMPVESAYVCVLFDTLIYETGYTDNNGEVNFPLNLPQPGDLELTLTGTNLYPYEATIPVISSSVYLTYDNYTINDSLGNNDSIANNNETILLTVGIKNIGAIAAQGVSAAINSSDTNLAIIDSISYYANIAAGNTATGSSPFVFSVSPASPSHQANFELKITDANHQTWINNFALPISGVGGSGGGEIGPDPYGYYIYDDTDTLTGNAPTYDWYEIAPPAGGSGSIVSQITNQDDDTVTITLPFTFTYYGLDYNTIGLCTNGYVELGSASYPSSNNTSIPASGGPKAMLAPFWDNLNPGYQHMGHGDIYQLYDAVNHRWILEFYQVAHRGYGGGYQQETFQIQLRDPNYYPTPTSDGEALFLYSAVANNTSNTVGIEDHTEARGLQYLYNNNYNANAAPLNAYRSLLITTKPPVVAPTSPWLYITSWTINDSIAGNNNGIIEPGETIYLTCSIENQGDTIAANTQGVLRILNSNAVLNDSTAIFGNIVVNGSANNNTTPFSLTVTPNPADSTIALILALSANDNTYQTEDYFTLYIYIEPGVKEEHIDLHNRPSTTLNILPNPSHKTVFIRGNTDCLGHNTLQIFDISGRLIKEFKLPVTAQQFHLTWDGCDTNGRMVSNGVYFIRLKTTFSQKTEHIILLK